ncbi:MAG: hypothetical protein RR341_06020, partial [Bacteroidales bacterium]
IQKLASSNFIVSIMRPPVIYGPGCKGNFPRLLKLAKYAIVFPNIENRRSMIYIDNFTECVRLIIDGSVGGIFFPQNKEYVSTKGVITRYRKVLGKSVLIVLLPMFIGKILSSNKLFNKAFGSKIYAKELSNHAEYNVVGFNEGIVRMSEHAG